MMVAAAVAAPKLSMGENLVMLNIQQSSCYKVAGKWIQKDLIECTNSWSVQKQFCYPKHGKISVGADQKTKLGLPYEPSTHKL